MNAENFEVSLYVPAVEAICKRIAIAEDALRQVEASPQNPLAFVGCEVAALQIRMICELFLLGSTAAHLLMPDLKISDNKWRPKDSFQELDKVNTHPLPMPVSVGLHENGSGQHHVQPKSQPIPFEALSAIYGKCGDLLHAPTTRQILNNRLPEFDLAVLWQWLSGFRDLAQSHVLMLPERKIVLLCIWSGDPRSDPEVFRLDAAGESTMDVSSYPAFSLFS